MNIHGEYEVVLKEGCGKDPAADAALALLESVNSHKIRCQMNSRFALTISILVINRLNIS